MLHDLDEIPLSEDLHLAGNQRLSFMTPDVNGRTIYISKLELVQFGGDSAYYPDVTIYSDIDQRFYSPIKEKTMSLGGVSGIEKPAFLQTIQTHSDIPVFYFIYNTDNYYHFIYDALPYLISYQYLRQQVTDLKLLMNFPNSQRKVFYKFVTEFLALLGIHQDDIVLADLSTQYRYVYLSSSYTHGHDSNAPPRAEIYDFFQSIVHANRDQLHGNAGRRLYISRRTWLHGDYSNIGTNYTTRRRLENEDDLVDLLVRKGFSEVFTENLSTLEKLDAFLHAEVVVGALGGGVCNVLFSPPTTRLLCVASPTFLDVNARFAHSFSHIDLTWFNETSHAETGLFKRFMRVSCPSRQIVGEITDIKPEGLEVAYTKEVIAGWNAQNVFDTILLPTEDCIPLDGGLNSAWRIDMESFQTTLETLL